MLGATTTVAPTIAADDAISTDGNGEPVAPTLKVPGRAIHHGFDRLATRAC
jgi:hypothetical protein